MVDSRKALTASEGIGSARIREQRIPKSSARPARRRDWCDATRRQHHWPCQGRFTRSASLARFLTPPVAVGLLLALAALLASPAAQAQTPLAPTSQTELDELLVGKRMLFAFPIRDANGDVVRLD